MEQLLVLELLESPQHTIDLSFLNEMINYTVSYRWDSDIVVPYGKYIPFDSPRMENAIKDYSTGKSRKVAWLVSNCFTRNRRREYANMLSKYIQVDVYGSCGNGRISHVEGKRLIKDKYKFYLAFENSNCRDYVTEKFFENALLNNAIPIVYGAEKAFYEQIAPPNSFIFALDFQSPKELAQYLHYLDQNSTAYNEFFQWKQLGRVSLDTKFWCRFCAFVQSPPSHFYEDVNSWWHQKKDCQKFTGFNFTSN
uniref:Fucosyltransferase n=1 Tax=Acrobeloides nanus TaxID=290746 RepID=A0A914DKM3_9BILA